VAVLSVLVGSGSVDPRNAVHGDTVRAAERDEDRLGEPVLEVNEGPKRYGPVMRPSTTGATGVAAFAR
jgi:hypothetical protein